MADWEDAPAGGGWEDAPKGRPLTGRVAKFISGNLNKGIAGTADAFLNAPNEVLNLVKAGVGTAATAAGHPDLAPDLTPNPNLVRRGMEKVGFIDKDSEATTTGQKAGAFGLELAGGMSVPIPGQKGKGAFTQLRDDATRAAAERSAQHATIDKALQESRKLGYVVPPSQVSSSLAGNALEGMVARTTPTERVASVRNAEVTNRLVRRELGLQPTQALTDGTFESIRRQAGEAYAAVKKSGVQIKPDKDFEEALGKIKSSDFGQASKEYEGVLANDAVENLAKGINKEVSSTAAVEMVKELRRRATRNLKSWDDLEKQDLGYAQRRSAQALEDLIERSLAGAGKGRLVKEWKEARQTIAKSYDAEAAWDGSNFSGKELAKLMENGSPLSGGMEQAAEFARHFPKAAQDVTKMAQKSGFSQYDLWSGVGAAMATGHPEAAAVAAVPWATQRALLTPFAQRMFASPDYSVGRGLRGAAMVDPALYQGARVAPLLAGQEGEEK